MTRYSAVCTPTVMQDSHYAGCSDHIAVKGSRRPSVLMVPDCLVSTGPCTVAVYVFNQSTQSVCLLPDPLCLATGRDLVNMAKNRPNVIPIIEDARHPQKYRMLVPMVDAVFADVAQPDQVSHITAHKFVTASVVIRHMQ